MWLRRFDANSASLLFAAAFLVSAGLGVVRQTLFNAQFGAGSDASAYYAAFRLPETLVLLIGGGSLSNVLIPVLARTAREDGPLAERQLVDQVLALMLAVFIPATALGIAGAPWFVRTVLAPGFDGPTGALAASLTRLMLLEAPLLAAGAVAIGVLNSRNQFLLPALSIAIHNITLIGGILTAWAFPAVGIYGPTIGAVGDALLQLCILLPGLRANGFRLRPRLALRARRLREVVVLLVPNSLSATANYAGTLVDTAFATLAREAAGLPAVANATLLIGLPTRLLGVAVGQAIFPRFAANAAAGDWPALRHEVWRTLRAVVGMSAPVALGLVAFGRPLVRLIFERGRFGPEAGDLTYAALAAYAVGLPAYVATEVLTRGLIALYDTRTPLLTNCLQVAGRAGMIVLLLDRLGIVAIPIAFAVTSTAEALLLGLALRWKLRASGRLFRTE